MLKKNTFVLAILLLSFVSAFAQLPYSKLLNWTKEELEEKKFKYESNMNRFVLSQSSGSNLTENELNPIGGSFMNNYSKHYKITIQKGAGNQTAFVNVSFYSDDTYNKLERWMVENNIKPIEANVGRFVFKRFDYDSYRVEISKEYIELKSFITDKSVTEGRDRSYNIYNYTIYTGVAPESIWHTKEAEKKAKNKLKGEKAELDDFM